MKGRTCQKAQIALTNLDVQIHISQEPPRAFPPLKSSTATLNTQNSEQQNQKFCSLH